MRATSTIADRRFSAIETWDNFLLKWERVCSVQAARALLEAVMDLHKQPRRRAEKERAELFAKQLDFMEQVTKNPDQRIAGLAWILLGTQWLEMVPKGESETLEIHGRLLSLLNPLSRRETMPHHILWYDCRTEVRRIVFLCRSP